MSRISGPLLDRVDIHIEVPAVPFDELAHGAAGTTSAMMRDQVTAARALQNQRKRTAVSELGLSARAHDKVIRVARTIADMESEAKIEPQHIEEAIQYRMLDRDVFN